MHHKEATDDSDRSACQPPVPARPARPVRRVALRPGGPGRADRPRQDELRALAGRDADTQFDADPVRLVQLVPGRRLARTLRRDLAHYRLYRQEFGTALP